MALLMGVTSHAPFIRQLLSPNRKYNDSLDELDASFPYSPVLFIRSV